MQTKHKILKIESETELSEVEFDIGQVTNHKVIEAIGFDDSFSKTVSDIRNEIHAAHNAKIDLYARLFEACVKATEEVNLHKMTQFLNSYEIAYNEDTHALKLALRCLTGYLVKRENKYGLIYQKSKVSSYGNGFIYAYQNGKRSAEDYKTFLNEEFKNKLTELNGQTEKDTLDDKYNSIDSKARDSVVTNIVSDLAEQFGDLVKASAEKFTDAIVNLTIDVSDNGNIRILKANKVQNKPYTDAIAEIEKDIVLSNAGMLQKENFVDLLSKKSSIKASMSELKVETKNGFGLITGADDDGNTIESKRFCVGTENNGIYFTIKDVKTFKLVLAVSKNHDCKLSVIEKDGEKYVQFKAKQQFSNLINLFNKDRTGRARADKVHELISKDSKNIILLRAAA